MEWQKIMISEDPGPFAKFLQFLRVLKSPGLGGRFRKRKKFAKYTISKRFLVAKPLYFTGKNFAIKFYAGVLFAKDLGRKLLYFAGENFAKRILRENFPNFGRKTFVFCR